jgi:OmcA/MtrC family decaheme c-type cytochrome
VLAQTARDVALNPVKYASVDGSAVMPRRQVVTLANCNTCHGRLFLHGGNRNNPEYCVFCHNPTKVSSASTAVPTGDSINFKNMIHKIHTGDNLTSDYTIGSSNFNEVAYPGDRRDCAKCHVNNSYNLPLPDSNINQVSPRDYINPMPPVSGACLSCHTDKPSAAHASVMTSPTLGESCDACHGQSSDASIDKVHAR